MSNMSYCRFENTLNDMRDCLNALHDEEIIMVDGKLQNTDEDGDTTPVNEYEARAIRNMVDVARELTEALEALTE